MRVQFNAVSDKPHMAARGTVFARQSTAPVWSFLAGLALVPLYLLSQPEPARVEDPSSAPAVVLAHAVPVDTSLPDRNESVRGESDWVVEMPPTF